MFKNWKNRDLYKVSNRGLIVLEGLSLILTSFVLVAHLFLGKSLSQADPLSLFKPHSSLVLIGLALNLLVTGLVLFGLVKNLLAPKSRKFASYLSYHLAMVWTLLTMLVDLLMGLDYQASLYLSQLLVLLMAFLAAQEYNYQERRMRRHNYIRSLMIR